MSVRHLSILSHRGNLTFCSGFFSNPCHRINEFCQNCHTLIYSILFPVICLFLYQKPLRGPWSWEVHLTNSFSPGKILYNNIGAFFQEFRVHINGFLGGKCFAVFAWQLSFKIYRKLPISPVGFICSKDLFAIFYRHCMEF